MSLPEQYQPNTTYMLTQRCSERRFFLEPSRQVDQAFLFCFLHAATKYNVHVHAYAVLSNHLHLIVTDVDAKLPDFAGWLNSQMACCMNVFYGRQENFWNPQTYSRVALADPVSVLDEMVYTIDNPVSSELVETPEEWPGLVSMPEDIGRRLTVDRPEWYFQENGPVPDFATGVLTVPPAFRHMEELDFKELLRGKVEARAEEIRCDVDVKGRTLLGRKAVFRERWDEKPKTTPPRGRLNPRIACKDPALLLARKEFQAAHREAREQFCEARGRCFCRMACFVFGGMRGCCAIPRHLPERLGSLSRLSVKEFDRSEHRSGRRCGLCGSGRCFSRAKVEFEG